MFKQLKKSFFSINKVVNHLKNGKIAILPTDTVYGISGIVPNSEDKIKNIKGRSETKPFIQLISEPDDIYLYTEKKIPDVIFNFWPGPLTIIVPVKETEKTVAFRCPADKWLRKIIKKCKSPIYSTSVNRSGMPLITNINDMIKEFSNEIDLVVYNGVLENKPSTIIDLTGDCPKIIRQGAIEINLNEMNC